MLPLRDRLPVRRTPVVTYLLIAANVLVYVAERFLAATVVTPEVLVRDHGFVPARFMASPLLELPNVLSSMFMHDPSGLVHIAGNMLFLWIFGDNVEDALGRGRFLAFYLLSGVFAAGAQLLVDPGSTVAMVGASGAISGVLAAYGSLYPRSPVTVLNPIPFLWLPFGLTFTLPAWILILEYFALNFLNGLGSLGNSGGGVAFFAHLGGFLAGLVLVRFFFDGRAVARVRPAPRPRASSLGGRGSRPSFRGFPSDRW